MDRNIVLIFILLSAIILVSGCVQTPEQIIKEKVIGKELKFYDIAGKEQSYIVSEDKIKSIELVTCLYKKNKCWRVNIEDMWHIYYDKDTLEELGIEQLFVT